jgi:hypothetical protein
MTQAAQAAVEDFHCRQSGQPVIFGIWRCNCAFAPSCAVRPCQACRRSTRAVVLPFSGEMHKKGVSWTPTMQSLQQPCNFQGCQAGQQPDQGRYRSRLPAWPRMQGGSPGILPHAMAQFEARTRKHGPTAHVRSAPDPVLGVIACSITAPGIPGPAAWRWRW